jgi:hypothetical protein
MIFPFPIASPLGRSLRLAYLHFGKSKGDWLAQFLISPTILGGSPRALIGAAT